MIIGQFFDKAGGDGAGPLTVNPAVCRVEDGTFFAGTGDRDIGEPALFLQGCETAFIKRSLRGEHAFFPAGQEDIVELQTLGAVHGHDRDFLAIIFGFIVHHEGNML